MANINNENEEGIKYFEQLELISDIFNKNYNDNYNLYKKILICLLINLQIQLIIIYLF